MIVLGDHHFLLRALNFGNLTTFRAISAIFSPHMRTKKRLYVNFRLNFLKPAFDHVAITIEPSVCGGDALYVKLL